MSPFGMLGGDISSLAVQEQTNGGRAAVPVVVVGAGPAGLTVGNLLRRRGVGCVLLERQPRERVLERQRAGVVEYRAVQMFERWGLAEALIGDIPADAALEIRVGGHPLSLDPEESGSHKMVLCPQQVLVQRSMELFLAEGGDLRFGVSDVSLHEVDTDHPVVAFRDAAGARQEIGCQVIAGCDGEHGVTRASLPLGAVSVYRYDHGIAWLSVLADSPPPRCSLLAASRHGFAGHFARGPRTSRYYLQCGLADTASDWPDERVWEQLRLRLGEPDLPTGPITAREVFPLRSLVHDPMAYGRLLLLGDAAHIIAPMGGKGMNLALYDAEVFVRAVCGLRSGDTAALESYSATCLRRVWNYQEFARWMTEMLHDAGDDSQVGPFRRQLALARLDRLANSPSAARAFGDLLSGLA
jgi:p-hydroxybenzoate 3-monooxygenase